VKDLNEFIVKSPQFRQKTAGKSEARIQAEIRPLIIRYLENHFRAAGYKDPVAKANASFFWEGQERGHQRQHAGYNFREPKLPRLHH
jgi:hypothetical protein